METLGAIGFVLLLMHAAAHVADVAAVARTSARRAALAFLFPPLGAVWAWEAGARRRAAAYGLTLVAFAAVVVAITHAR
jgi:hypothetical protein